MSHYECKRCSHITKQKIEMIRHLNRKIKCSKHIDSYQYSENELYDMSLKRIKPIKNEQIIEYKCTICQKKYQTKFNLERHQLTCNEKPDVLNIINNTNNSNNTIHNNIQINVKIEPFDNDWNISKINKFTKHSLLLSKIMYTNLLKTILENESNLNVIIEKDSNEGIVYKNDIDKFIKMKLKDIVDNSMYKLNKHLKHFYDESITDEEFILMDQIFAEQKDFIDEKYKDYKNNKEIQKKVEKFIADIYDAKKEEALQLYNQILIQNKDENLLSGF